jgi:glutamate N-acetyltransferase/amino-acid N-acetyltransferase
VDAVSVTAAGGIRASGVAAGVKTGGGSDVALVVADPGSVAVAVFTTNRASAAPVTLSRKHLASGASTRAVVLNSGSANAATGAVGDSHAAAMTAAVAAAVGCDVTEVLVCSTGPIGTTLPIDRILNGIGDAAAHLGDAPDDALAAAEAILTTDSCTKEAVRHGVGLTVGGMAKGSGMIRPDMATMLAVITTDALADPEVLDGALRSAVDHSFHALDIDGCPSTNDTVILIASGASGVTADGDGLTALVGDVCADLAHQIAADAEGATRVVTLASAGASDADTARRVGRAVADSTLVRSACHGGDPNWGRIVAALGSTDLTYEPDGVDIDFEDVRVTAGGPRSSTPESRGSTSRACRRFSFQRPAG